MSLDVQEPPAVPELVNVVVANWQIGVVPDIVPAVAAAITVMGTAKLQPAVVVYVINTGPALTPVTTPDDAPTVANSGSEEDHVPEDGVAESVTVLPVHTLEAPEITGS
jgi:hypothetical protein